ncbi:MAG: phage/plasmid primase, P4 family [Pseudomonadota bacterium]
MRDYRLEDFPKAEPVVAASPPVAPTAGEAAYTVEAFRSAQVSSIAEIDAPDRAKDIALNGETEHDKPDDTSRSGWLFSMLTTCTRAGVDPSPLVRSSDLHESLQAHITENGGERYVVAQIKKAYEKAPCVVPEQNSVAMSEDDLALRFARLHEDDLRFCAQRGLWFTWDDTRWCPEETLLAWDLVKQLLREAAKYVDPEKPNAKRSLLSKSKIAAVETLARSDRRMAITLDQFDADPMLLNTPGGVVDLNNGELTASSPELYCTKQTAVTPQRGEPRRFLEFLNWACAGDGEFVDYVQRIMGYCLTGETKEHALFFVHGPGGNGKSVLQDILQWLLADYATSTTFDTLAISNGVQHPTDIAGMKGARLVVAPETEANQRWAEAKIKRMTGGDRIAARFMRQDFFEYTPQFKLFVVGNHKPGFQNVDHAIRRRIHLLPFNQEIAADQVDRDLGRKLKQEEGGQILSWAIDGALAWAERGLSAPKIITGATDDYLEDEDIIGSFLNECCELDGGFTSGADLYKSYSAWCRLAGEAALSRKRFQTQLEYRGLPPERGTGGVRGRHVTLSPRGLEVITEVTGERDHYPKHF